MRQSESVLLLCCVLSLLGTAQCQSHADWFKFFDYSVEGRQIRNRAVEVDASDIPRSVHHTVVGRDGLIYASSFISNEVFSGVPDEKGSWRWVRVVGKTGGPDGPTGLSLDEQLRLYVASFGTDQIMRYDSVTGKFLDIFVNDEGGYMDCPEGILLLNDRLLVASFLNDRIISYNLDGSFQEIFGAGWHLDGPQMMLQHPGNGELLVSSYHRDKIVALDQETGKKIREFGGKELSRPVGLSAAPDGQLLISSHKTNEILRYNAASGKFIDVFASGHGLWAPTGIALTTDLVLFVGTFFDGLRRYSYWR